MHTFGHRMPAVADNARNRGRYPNAYGLSQDPAESKYDCDVAKRSYIDLLREYDARQLAAFVGVQPIE
jgi:hypothetical protein